MTRAGGGSCPLTVCKINDSRPMIASGGMAMVDAYYSYLERISRAFEDDFLMFHAGRGRHDITRLAFQDLRNPEAVALFIGLKDKMRIAARLLAPRTRDAIDQVPSRYLTIDRLESILAAENQADRRQQQQRAAAQQRNRKNLDDALRARAAQKDHSRDRDKGREC
jgi:hypothetical protein